MNILEEKFDELNSDGVFSYILKTDSDYYDTAYKVMKNSVQTNLLQCQKIRFNGKLKFLYFTNEMYSLEAFITRSDPNEIITAIIHMSNALGEICNNGFLNIACIDNRLSRIFVDKKKKKVSFVYLPVQLESGAIIKSEFENEIRTQLLSLFSTARLEQNFELQPLLQVLRDGTMSSLTELAQRLGEVQSSSDKLWTSVPQSETGNLSRIVLMSVEGSSRFVIEQFPFVIGKNPQKVNGVINNPAVSRVHCEIRKDNGLFLYDLNSANGTYLNGEKVMPNSPVNIRIGDIIRIANQKYKVQG